MTDIVVFQPWPKTPRLFRDCVITEKIDGTNAAVGIIPIDGDGWQPSEGVIVPGHATDEPDYLLYTQSRNRIITPDKDNQGFARWAWENASTLFTDLGPGLHFGEWWGAGIQRGYGQDGRIFSLFNADRHQHLLADAETPGLSVVPVLYRGVFDTDHIKDALDTLDLYGSMAAPDFMRPEGVCVFHSASRQVFKALLENDQLAKSDLVRAAA